jgi:hypothetical protein
MVTGELGFHAAARRTSLAGVEVERRSGIADLPGCGKKAAQAIARHRFDVARWQTPGAPARQAGSRISALSSENRPTPYGA